MGRECDRLWSLIVRSRGSCEAEGPHNGALQGAHGFSRRYRNTRWLPINGFCLCAGHHITYTYDPLAWDDFLRRAWGLPVYEELKRLAQKTTPPDVSAALEVLLSEARSHASIYSKSGAVDTVDTGRNADADNTTTCENDLGTAVVIPPVDCTNEKGDGRNDA